MLYNSGKLQSAKDAVLRYKPFHMLYISVRQTSVTNENEDVKELIGIDLEVVRIAIKFVSSDADANMMSWNIVHRATQEDRTILRLMGNIQRGIPDSGLEMDKDMREFHRFRHDLHVVDGVLCYRDRIVVPAALQGQVLSGIHAAHQGVSGQESTQTSSELEGQLYDLHQRSALTASSLPSGYIKPRLHLPDVGS